MEKEAKSLLVYAALALVLIIVSVVLVKAIASFSFGDSDIYISYNLVTEAKAGRVYTPNCLIDCHLPFCITPSGNSLASSIPFTEKDITQQLIFTESSDQSLLKEIGVDYLATETYSVEVPVIGTCQEEILNNVTGQNETYSYECVLETKQEQITHDVWKPLKDISQLTLEAGKEQCFDIWGKLQPRLNGNFAVDVIPHVTLQGKEFIMSELAWWNETGISYKRLLTFNSTRAGTIRIPYAINGSEGINGSTIWTLPEQNISNSSNYTEWLYYNSWNDLHIVNQSENATLAHDVENGTAPSNDPKSVWLGNYLSYVFHMNGSASNASGGNGTASGITYTNSGKFGQAAVFAVGSDRIDIGDIDEAANNGEYSLEFWIYPTKTPGTWSHVFHNWDRAVSIRHTAQGELAFDTDTAFSCGNGDTVTANQTLNQSAWNHVVATTKDNGSNEILYVWQNGILVVARPHCSNNHTGIARIGYTSNAFGEGRIDEFRIYNKTITEDDARALYEQGKYRRSELGNQTINSDIATELLGDDSIRDGITASGINASNFTNQRIYSRLDNGTQQLGKFDWVIVSGNQTCAFNYVSSDEDTSNFTYMPNMAPVLYFWENHTLTTTQIASQVTSFIDSNCNSTI